MSVPTTPRRRSQRGQPVPMSPTKSRTGSADDLNIRWEGRAIYERPTNPEHDLLDRDTSEAWHAQEEESKKNSATTFYRSFSMNQSPQHSKRGQKSKARPASTIRETYQVGDTILVHSLSMSPYKQPSVAVIIAMFELDIQNEDGLDDRSTDAKTQIRVHWFIRPNELPSNRVRYELEENEIYYVMSSSIADITPSCIKSRCTVTALNPSDSVREITTGKTHNKWDASLHVKATDSLSGTEFQCRYARHPSKGTCYEFNWETHVQEALAKTAKDQCDDLTAWDVKVDEKKKQAPAAKKKPAPKAKGKAKKVVVEVVPDSEDESDGPEDDDYDQEQNEDDEDEQEESDDDDQSIASDDDAFSADGDEDDDPKTASTASRKRKRAATASPRKRSPTKKPRLAKPLPKKKRAVKVPKVTTDETVKSLPPDPYLRALHVLHVGARPMELPCRDREYSNVLRVVKDMLEEGSGGCVYISGVPGTGKTATVHSVIRELRRMADDNETNPFSYVEINGLKIPEPTAAYRILWETLNNENGPRNISAKESLRLLTDHFAQRSMNKGPANHACVVLMDELDQLVTAKQDVIYNFFNWPTLVGSKLIVIAVANTHDLPERTMNGRVRSRLGMTRINFNPYNKDELISIVKARLATTNAGLDKPLESVIHEDALKMAAMKISSVSGDVRRVLDICRRAVELVRPQKKIVKVNHVATVVKEMQNSPTAQYLRDCSFHERMMLASLVKCMKREGVEEIKWGDVQHQHYNYLGILSNDIDSSRKPTTHELLQVLLSLVASRAMLLEDGAAAQRKPEDERKVLLNLEQIEVERVLGDIGGDRWKNLLNAS